MLQALGKELQICKKVKKSRDGESKEDNIKCKMQERKREHFGHGKIPY